MQAQIQTPVKWSYAAKKLNDREAILFLKADLMLGWHIYSMRPPEGESISTAFTFISTSDYEVIGDVTEPKPIKKHEKTFDENVYYFEKSVIFQQKIQLNRDVAVVKGKVLFMACNDKMCTSPTEVSFEITVK